jgi:glycosyltransferase involved in cell wall biosynthesis
VLSHSHALGERGHSFAIAGERGAWHEAFERSPFPWIDVPFKGGLMAQARCARILSAWLKENPVDLIHTHYRRPTLVARRIQRTFDVPILYTVHLSDLSLAGPRRWFTDFGDHTHVASDEARQWVIEQGRVPADRVSLIPHGVDAERFALADDATRSRAKAALGFGPGDRVAAFVGRFDVPKNEDWIIDIAAATRQSLPEMRFVLLGEGPHEAALRRRIESMGLSERVRLLPRQDPLPIYQASDALLLPSIREGFSLVCAEAMAVGVPVLRTRTAGTAQLIRENVTGRSVPIDHDAFVSAAVEFLRDREALRRMGLAAAQHVRANFRFADQVERTLDLYRRLTTLSRR